MSTDCVSRTHKLSLFAAALKLRVVANKVRSFPPCACISSIGERTQYAAHKYIIGIPLVLFCHCLIHTHIHTFSLFSCNHIHCGSQRLLAPPATLTYTHTLDLLPAPSSNAIQSSSFPTSLTHLTLKASSCSTHVLSYITKLPSLQLFRVNRTVDVLSQPDVRFTSTLNNLFMFSETPSQARDNLCQMTNLSKLYVHSPGLSVASWPTLTDLNIFHVHNEDAHFDMSPFSHRVSCALKQFSHLLSNTVPISTLRFLPCAHTTPRLPPLSPLCPPVST